MIIAKRIPWWNFWELNRAFRLRYFAYVPAYISPEDCPGNVEKDEHDKHSDTFIAYDGKEIAGTVRLIRHSPLGFPTENFYVFEEGEKIPENKREIMEISRLITAEGASPAVVRLLFLAICRYAAKKGVKYFYATLSEKHMRALIAMGFDVRRIRTKEFRMPDRYRKYFQKGNKTPMILSLEGMSDKLRERISR